MSTDDELRKTAVEQRQHEAHTQETMASRTAETLDALSDPWVEEEARELLTEQRHHEELRQQSAHSRNAAEIGLIEAPHASDQSS